MAIPKVVGTETEYGIFGPVTPDFNPVLASSFLINAYAGNLRRIRWDYEQESPLRDARGFEPVQERQPVDEELGLANVILPNGARYYVDHAHPEYSTPECAGPRELVAHDKAGELVLERSLEAVQVMLPPGERIAVYKNNTDGKGNSYGTHENYLVDRRTPFTRVVRDLTPFFVTRQIFTGAGKLGSESARGSEQRIVYQLTQRADFFEAEVGLETTLKRPIINTRDEPHADPEKYRRLHCIVGDANMCEVATYLKVGTTALILKMIEDELCPEVSLDNPVQALHEVSWDPTCRQTVKLTDGRRVRPLELQWDYLDHAKKYVKENDATAENGEVLQRWEAVLTGHRGGPALHAPRAGLGGEVPAADGVPRAGRPGLARPAAGDDRAAVPRRPPVEGPVLPAGGGRQDRADRVRPGGPGGGRRAARGHAGLLPRPLHRALPGRDRRRVLGFHHLRHGRGRSPARADARAPPGNARARRGACWRNRKLPRR